MRRGLLWLSRRRSFGRLATRLPVARGMVARFVSGETLAEALPALERVRAAGKRTTVDVLGESVTTADAADAAADRYLELLDALDGRGLDGNVSLKLSQMGLAVDPTVCHANVARIFRRAAERGAFVRIDMEDHTTVDATLRLWRELRTINPASGVVIQSALLRSPADIEALIAERGRVRLCKGAYREPHSVAHQDKAAVDRAYAALMDRLLHDGEYPAFATHDERLIRRAIAVARARPARAGAVRVPDALRRSPRPAGLAGPGRLDGPRLRALRAGVVSVLHAPTRRAPRERRLHPAQRAPRRARRRIERERRFEHGLTPDATKPPGRDGRLVDRAAKGGVSRPGCSEPALAGFENESQARQRAQSQEDPDGLELDPLHRRPSWSPPGWARGGDAKATVVLGPAVGKWPGGTSTP